MTIREAHTEWGRKSEHSVVYQRTKDVFLTGFDVLDLDKATSFYSKQEYATALAYSKLKKEEKPVAASVMFHVLTYAHEKVPNKQPPIDFSHKDLLGYEPCVPATDPVEPTSVLAYNTVPTVNVNVNDNVNDNDNDNANVNENISHQTSNISHRRSPNDQTTKSPNNMTKKKKATRPTSKAVKQIDLKTGEVVSTFESLAEAGRVTEIKNIRRAIARNGTAGGYKWEFTASPPTPLRGKGSRKSVSGERLAVSESQPSAVSPQPSDISHQPSLADFTDQDLVAEIKRRGWKGDITITMNITL